MPELRMEKPKVAISVPAWIFRDMQQVQIKNGRAICKIEEKEMKYPDAEKFIHKLITLKRDGGEFTARIIRVVGWYECDKAMMPICVVEKFSDGERSCIGHVYVNLRTMTGEAE